MASIPGSVTITGFVAPTDTADTYPTHDETYGRGGYRTVANTTARDAIPADRRLEGMLVYVVATDTTYQLGSDLLTWSAYGAGGSTPGNLTSGLGMKGANTPTSMTQDITLDVDASDFTAGALHRDENDYVPVYDDSTGQTVKVKVVHITDGGTF